MLAATGAQPRTLYRSEVGPAGAGSGVPPVRCGDRWPTPVYALAFRLADAGTRHALLVSKTSAPLTLHLIANGSTAEAGAPPPRPTVAQVLEGVGAEPGFAPPVTRALRADGSLELGPFGVALVDFL